MGKYSKLSTPKSKTHIFAYSTDYRDLIRTVEYVEYLMYQGVAEADIFEKNVKSIYSIKNP